MKKIDGIRANGTQEFSIAAETGILIRIKLYFQPAIRQWKMDLSYNSFVLNGNRVSNFPNLLCQYANILPFGLACIVSDGGDPFLINDFSDGRASLYLLSSSERDSLEQSLMSEEF